MHDRIESDEDKTINNLVSEYIEMSIRLQTTGW